MSVELLIDNAISTHILTKRMTLYSRSYLSADSISTHILTKRMTRTVWIVESTPSYFNSHPHEEDDKFFTDKFGEHDISTHILTKRMTKL